MLCCIQTLLLRSVVLALLPACATGHEYCGQQGGEQQDGRGYPERDGEAVYRPVLLGAEGRGVGGKVGGGGGRGDGVEEGGAQRAADLLGGVDRGRGGSGVGGRYSGRGRS